MGTLASALSCQRDQYDRPITGSIDFCLEGMRGTSVLNVAGLIAQEEKGGMTGVMVGGEGDVSEKWDGWNGGKEANVGVARDGNDGGSLGVANREMIQYSVGVAVHGEFQILGMNVIW